ncbi:MAG: hypothetical protein AAFS10_02960 [Myxococcota bacterium]
MNTTNAWLAQLRALMAEAPEDAMVHKLAREYVEGHLEQSTSEYEPYSPRTPFATYSWEERFAIDGFDHEEALLTIALKLHLHCHGRRRVTEDALVFSGYREGGRRLAISAPLYGSPWPLTQEPWEMMFEEQTLSATVQHAVRWLGEEADYPDRPWFDGGEAMGFQVYDVPWGQEIGPCGFMVLEPKWFEIHK